MRYFNKTHLPLLKSKKLQNGKTNEKNEMTNPINWNKFQFQWAFEL
jgi:hypothetical protein